jgi:hypothetical protein
MNRMRSGHARDLIKQPIQKSVYLSELTVTTNG